MCVLHENLASVRHTAPPVPYLATSLHIYVCDLAAPENVIIWAFS